MVITVHKTNDSKGVIRMDGFEKFCEGVYNLSKLKEEQSFNFVSAVIDCIRNNKEIHDYDFIYKFCSDRIAFEKSRIINGNLVSENYFEGKSFWDFDKQCIKYIKAVHERCHSETGDKLTDMEYKEATIFLRMYVILVCEEALDKKDEDKIIIAGDPFMSHFTKEDVKRVIEKFLKEKSSI